MNTVNALNSKVDLSVRVFDNFYNYEQNVPSQEYDLVNSFFLTVFKTAEAAGNFTVSLFRIADQTGTPVLTLLQQIQGQNQIQVTETLSYYLNNLRSLDCTAFSVHTFDS